MRIAAKDSGDCPGICLDHGRVFLYHGREHGRTPGGLAIASCFVAAILFSSFYSRLRRSTELRFQGFEFADGESKLMWDALKHLEFPVLVPHRPGGDHSNLAEKDANIRQRHRSVPKHQLSLSKPRSAIRASSR